LLFYFWKYTNKNWNNNPKYTDIKASENPSQFEFNLKEDKYIKKQMQKTALLSYLLYEDGKVVVDEISPKDKFGKVFTNETKYHSQSVGKSFASYILGHAICKGYVDGIDAKLNDWPVLENTLYYDQKIIDVINMNAGDKKYFASTNEFNNPKFRYSVTNRTILSAMKNELKNSKKSGSKWNYNNLLPHLILNYIIFKAGEDGFQSLLNEIFREKVGIEHDATLVASEQSGYNNKSTTNTFLITRYDYLRVARAMLEDWQNDTCEGKYLKSLFERKVKKNKDYRDKKHAHSNTKSYAGFFHLEPSGMKGRHIFIMDGYGGQTLTIDFDTGRIVATLAVHRNFNWMKIAHSVIKKGK
jgi:CubicO group peptidase (beta-lactamase class C family)